MARDEDPMPTETDEAGGLRIGVGAGLEPESYWIGLIDEVRIYSRAIELEL